MTNPFKISEEEKNRILGLHETYKNTQGGLIIEQEDVVVVDNKNPNYETEMAELTSLGYEIWHKAGEIEKEEIEDMRKGAEEENYDFEVLYDGEGGIVTFTRERSETKEWENKDEDKKDDESKVRDDAKIQKAKRDFEAYFRNKISGQQINIYSSRKTRDAQKQKGGFMDKGLIASVIFAQASGSNPAPIRNKNKQIIGMELGLTDDKGSIRYKCSSNLEKLEDSVQYILANGKKGGRWKEWIGPKDFVDVAMKTLCSKLHIYMKEMSKVPSTTKFGDKVTTSKKSDDGGLFSS